LFSDLDARFKGKQGFSIATINLDHVVKFKQNAAFLTAYGAHTHITADGNPIVWLCHLAGQRDVELIPGSEIVEPVINLAAENGAKVALLGSTEESLQAAADALRARNPALDVALCFAPSMQFDPDGAEGEAAIKAIKDSGVRLVCLALGAPKQERFAARAQTALPQVGFLSIGAGLDFISGNQKRAPKWVRKIAAEWIWRMMGNPRRLIGRYTACALAMPGLTLRAMKQRKA
jgi:exopolysaccharide biosynthesis WecB/TagA/CpsF family protein